MLSKHKLSMGTIALQSTERGLCKLYFPQMHSPPISEIIPPWHAQAAQLLTAYLHGEKVDFRGLPLDITGTDFQLSIWEQVRAIPYGETRFYAELGPARAVGTACRLNPLPLIIPCHRIIPQSGGIGQYAGGVQLKKTLLSLEHAL